tara:strand:- start:7757 stop:7969 length:213 start_codon:yes stop_codon:yes gene_type:complete
LIDFFFVGPSKTASTWLYQALSEHPEFSLPKAKKIFISLISFLIKALSGITINSKGVTSASMLGIFPMII